MLYTKIITHYSTLKQGGKMLIKKGKIIRPTSTKTKLPQINGESHVCQKCKKSFPSPTGIHSISTLTACPFCGSTQVAPATPS